jgi:hypothetical protein
MAQQDDAAQHRWTRILLALLFAAPLAILALLLIPGERANYVVSILALLFAFVFGMAPLLAGRNVHEAWQALPRTRRRWYRLGVFALSVALSTALYSLAYASEVPVTPAKLRVDGSDQLTPTTPATIVFLDPTPARDHLGLRLHLDDYVGSGDCTTSATLTLTPMKGGQQAPAVQVANPGTEFREPEEVTIPIKGTVQDLRIAVALNSGVGCKLRLVVREAVFYD